MPAHSFKRCSKQNHRAFRGNILDLTFKSLIRHNLNLKMRNIVIEVNIAWWEVDYFRLPTSRRGSDSSNVSRFNVQSAKAHLVNDNFPYPRHRQGKLSTFLAYTTEHLLNL